ncbi:hypothetical protein HRbin12_00250 [bacterium HR12]|nr:hypothetical protein HRbin12_00250 [bacterium HR12]
MLLDVRDGLLRDAEEGRSELGGWLDLQPVLQLDGGPRTPPRMFQVLPERGDEPLAIQGRRTQLEQQVAQPLDGVGQRLVQRLGLRPQLGIRDALRERLGPQVRGGDHLDRVVVDVGGDPTTLLLLGLLEPRGEPPPILHRPAQDLQAPLELLLGALPVGDVEHDAPPVRRSTGGIPHQDRLVPDPDLAAVGGDEPVLRAEGFPGLVGPAVQREDPLPVLLVQSRHPEVRLFAPLLDGEAQDLLDLRARVDVRGDVVDGVDVEDRRDPLDEAPVRLLRLPQSEHELRGDIAHPHSL